MLSEQQRSFKNNLKQAILRLCHDGVPHTGKIEVDGLICIHVEDEPQDLIIKIHESLFKTSPVVNSDLFHHPPSVQSHWRPALSFPSQPSTSQYVSNDGPLELRDLLSQSRSSLLAVNDNQISDCDEDMCRENTEEGGETSEIIQAPLYRQLWDKYKDSGNGGSMRRGMKVPQNEIGSIGGGAAVVLPCKICRTMITGVDKLEKHYSVQHKVHMCKQCFRTFSMYSNLKRHMRLHTGQRPYRCTICGKTFTRKDDLTNHILKHKDSKPFTCGICRKGYTERSSIRGHLRRDHDADADDIHICTQCGVSFAAVNSFVTHLKTHSKSLASGHSAFVQEHSSVVSNQKSSSSIALTYPALTYESNNDGSEGEPVENQELDTKLEGSNHDSVELENNRTSSHPESIPQKQLLDVIVSRPDGSPCSVSVKVGHLVVAPDTRDSDSDSQGPTVNHASTNRRDDYECKYCPMMFSSFAELSHHSVKQHGKHCCVHCPHSTFDSVEELNDHMFQCHPGDQCHHGDDAGAKENGDVQSDKCMETVKVEDAMEIDTPASVKIKQELPDIDEQDRVTPENRSSPFPVYTSLSQPVFPGSPVHYQPDRNLSASSSAVSDFAMSKSVDSHSFGRIIEIKNTYLGNGSSAKKPRASGIKQPYRDQQGELVCPPSYQCSVCKDVFTDTEEFLNHCTDSHQRFGCKYCGQMFTQCGNRNRHLRYHSGDRPFVCAECGDTFARQDALKNHVDARHKKSACPICGLTFAKPSQASQHLKSDHGVCNA